MRSVLVAIGLATGALSSLAHAVPSFDEVRAAYRTSETTVVDRRGEVIQVMRTDPQVRKLGWTSLADVSPALRAALVYSEDRRFYAHAGIDWQAVGSAAWGNVWNTRTRGASTITMQLAGLLDDDLRSRNGGRSIAQKFGQAATALALERSWKKDQILEAYLNLVAYRGEVVGIAALSATLFEKYPSGLDARESAIAAAFVRAPNASAARVSSRACEILEAEALNDECRGLGDYTASMLSRRAAPRLDSDPQIAPHAARLVLRPVAGASPKTAVVKTTLDAALQRFARATLRAQLAELAQRNVEDGAVVVLDNASGEVLAWVGSSGDLSDAADVDHALAPRQAGSTLKPFLYSLAIEKRWLTAASILDDSPVNLQTANGLYIPQNYDHDFKGPVSVRTALASSLNVPAVRTLVMVTPERFHQRLRALGLTTLRESGDYYGYALALGSAEVTLAQLTNAYRVLARGGDAQSFTFVKRNAPPSSRVVDPGAAAIVGDILADRNARATTFGMDSVLGTRTWAAVKTGTSKDMRDNWCVGYTSRYTIGVWVGNASGALMWDVSGTSGAAPVWATLVGYLAARDRRAGLHDDRPAEPAGIVRTALRFDRDLEAPREELFLAGSEATRITRSGALAAPAAAERSTGLISSPVDGTVVALDPDIPPARQRMTFRAAADGARAQWRLDGRTVGRGRQVGWALWPGKHRLELLDAADRVVDRVGFEVRGADVRGADRREVVARR